MGTMDVSRLNPIWNIATFSMHKYPSQTSHFIFFEKEVGRIGV